MKAFFLTFVFVFGVTSVFHGCDKLAGPAESGGGEIDPELSKQKVDEANKILIPKIIMLAQSGPDTTGIDVSAEAALYQEALDADPNNGDAHFGLALTDLISLVPELTAIAGNMTSYTPSTVTAILRGEANTPEVLGDLSTVLTDRIKNLAKQRVEAAMGRAEPALVPGQAAGIFSQQELPSYYQDIVENIVLPKLTSAANHLIAVTQIPGYAFLITPEMTGNVTTETYRIDHTEIYLLLALVQGVTAEGSVFVSYDIDYLPTDSAAVAEAWEVSSAFLAFRPNGAVRMQNARTHFVDMASSIQGGLNHLMNEPANDEVDLIEYNPADESAFLEAIMILDTVKIILSGPYTIPDGPTIDLKNFFDDAIPNYKEKVPPYTVTVVAGSNPGRYDALLTWTATSFETWIFPDPTMNGLFPGMTDAEFKMLLGLTPDTWTQEVVIKD